MHKIIDNSKQAQNESTIPLGMSTREDLQLHLWQRSLEVIYKLLLTRDDHPPEEVRQLLEMLLVIDKAIIETVCRTRQSLPSPFEA